MLFKLTNDEIRVLCRRQIEAFEYWSRRLIHQKLSTYYGENYFSYYEGEDNYIIKKSIREATTNRYEKNKTRYTRIIDALLLDDIISILCNPNLYKRHFKDALKNAYPNGNDEAKVFLDRLLIPRNNLSHANPISIRQAEQVICYTNDFIDSIKEYYIQEKIHMDFNVPQIIKITDSLGNEIYRENCFKTYDGVIWSKEIKKECILRPGDTYRMEVEVDTAFNNDDYDIKWSDDVNGNAENFKNKPYYEIYITNEYVSENFIIRCTITSKESWHKYRYHDDAMSSLLTVLPPI